jgi:ketosteroid isomerase-like protein
MQMMLSLWKSIVLAITIFMVSGCASVGKPDSTQAPGPSVVAAEHVRLAELAFAKTMADRDFPAFVSHLSSEAIFFGDRSIKHGSAEVSAAWKPFFSDTTAPFAWAPDHVEVLSSGNIALSTGPVYVGGKVVGRFNSIWRLEAPNTWRIVFDKGEAVCATIQ